MDRQMFLQKLFEAAKAAGIAECEAYIAKGDQFDVDVLEGQIKEYACATSAGMCFRGVYGGKMGYASTEEMDEDAVDMLVGSVKENAKLMEADDGETIFEGGGEYAKLDLYDEETAAMPASEKIAVALSMEKTMKAADPRVLRVEGCGYGSITAEKQIVNSRGLDIRYRSSIVGAAAVPVVRENGKVNHAFEIQYAYHKQEVDGDAIAKKAVTEALRGLRAHSVPSGNYAVVLRNDVASTLLSTFSGVFSGENARKGLTLLKNREGDAIASKSVTIVDDPHLSGGLASRPFDAEGVATFAKTVVDEGVLRTLLHNRSTASAMGARTTGNAAKEGYAAPVRVAPSNFYILPSTTTFEDMLVSVGDGLLITSLMGMHSGANQISGDFSLGAKGFCIRHGEIADSVEQITVAGNFFELLSRVRAAASDLRFPRPGASSYGSPSLHIDGLSVAGV